MDSNWMILSCLVAGISLLLYSAPSAYALSKSAPTHRPMWIALFLVICIFAAAYAWLFAQIAAQDSGQWLEPVVFALLLFGAMFVVAVTKLSQQAVLYTSSLESNASYDSMHDHLTGISNRRCFLQEMSAMIERQTPFVLLMLDLEKFKQINDALGHSHGDEALIQVADRLGSSLQSTQKVFRLGGDEFAIVELDSVRAEHTAQRILEHMRAPITLDEMTVDLGASIGMSNHPLHGEDITTLISRADMALFESKKHHLGWSWFQSDLEPIMRRKLSISSNLRKAVAGNQLLLHYQPICSNDGRNIHSVEALLRWPVRNGEFISPQEFIPIAEEERMVDAITNWVVQAAVRQLGEWLREGLQVRMNINLSALDLQDQHLWSRISAILDAEHVPASHITLELTESAMMHDEDQSLATIEKISNGGAQVAIDDFGTGYSSMARLKDLPIDQIKIDRCFVRDVVDNPQDAAIVNATVFLAQNLGCTVTAEGVETAEAAEQLRSLGCDLLQGFYFARPQGAADIRELLLQEKKSLGWRKTG